MSAQPERTVSSVFHRRPGDEYPVFVRGEGSYLWDDQGKRYLDCSSGMAWSASLGQGRPDIAETLADQAGQLTYIHNAWASTDRQEGVCSSANVSRARGSQQSDVHLRRIRIERARASHRSPVSPVGWRPEPLEGDHSRAQLSRCDRGRPLDDGKDQRQRDGDDRL